MTSEPPAPRDGAPQQISYYRLVRVLGSGGMGVVYEATDTRNDARVALKLVHAHLEADESYRDRFIREAHVASLLRSPYTVHLLDYGEEEGRFYLVMRLVRGGQTVRDLLQLGALPRDRALRIASQIARALEEAQTRGVTHRDLKPENIMVAPDGTALLADFGIARQSGGATISATGVFIGTPMYAAPEVADGRADHRSDIYSLGVTLYHLLTGHPPFEGGPLELLRQHAEAPMPREPLADLPQELVALLAGCMAKDPAERYQSATEVAGVLEQLAEQAAERSEREAQPPLTATITAPVDRATPADRAAPTGAPTTTLTLDLSAPSVSRRFLPRRQSAHYELLLRNDGDRTMELLLGATDEQEACLFALPDQVSVAPHEQTTVTLEVQPRRRRWRGGSERRPFSVTVSDRGGGPPLNVAGQFEDVPQGWLPYGGGAVFSLGLVALVAALLFGRYGEQQATVPLSGQEPPTAVAAETAAPTPTPTPPPTPTATATATPTPIPAPTPEPVQAGTIGGLRILFDESHGQDLTVDADRAALLNPENPTWPLIFFYLNRSLDRLAVTSVAAIELSSYDVVVIPDASTEWFYSVPEIAALSAYVSAGGGLLLVGSRSSDFAGLGPEFGVRFDPTALVVDENAPEWVQDAWTFRLELAPHAVTFGLREIDVSWTGSLDPGPGWQVIARTGPNPWKDDDGDGEHDRNELSGPFDIVAARDFGAGRVVAVADDWLFLQSTGSSALRRNIIDWLGGR